LCFAHKTSKNRRLGDFYPANSESRPDNPPGYGTHCNQTGKGACLPPRFFSYGDDGSQFDQVSSGPLGST
jgi:hypothetical protein